MNRAHSIALLGLLGLAFAVGLPACGGGGPPSLSAARQFDAYRVYYPGSEVGRIPLTRVTEEESRGEGGRKARWSFVYGSCSPSGDSGCRPPVEIQNYSVCTRWAAAYPGKRRLFDLRGAKAAWVAGNLDVYTGRTTVVIFTYDHSTAKSVARRLREVGRAHSGAQLPPPAPGSLEGKLPCQGKPG